MSMSPSFNEALSRFKEGFAYTSEEQQEFDDCERENRDNVEAIMGGYSAANRRFRKPEVPDFMDRVRRGIRQAIDR